MKKPNLAIAIIPKGGPTDESESNPMPDLGGGGSSPDYGVGQLCLPQDVVATADDQDQKVAPGVGDEVRFDCVAKVIRVANGNVYLTPTEVNGTAVGDQGDNAKMGEGPDADLEGDSDQSLRDLALQADGGAGRGI